MSFNFMAAVTVHSDFGAQGNKICHYFYFFPFYLPWSDETGYYNFSLFNAEFQVSIFTLSPSPRGSLVPLRILPLEWYHLHIWGCCCFSQQSWFQPGISHDVPSSQGYDFSCGHVWMWELDHKEGWEPKNWCFWTVVLEKTLESPLDCKEIKPVNPKGNQLWIVH